MRSHLPAEAVVACILTRARGKTVDALFVGHRLAALLLQVSLSGPVSATIRGNPLTRIVNIHVLQVYNIHLTAWEG